MCFSCVSSRPECVWCNSDLTCTVKSSPTCSNPSTVFVSNVSCPCTVLSFALLIVSLLSLFDVLLHFPKCSCRSCECESTTWFHSRRKSHRSEWIVVTRYNTIPKRFLWFQYNSCASIRNNQQFSHMFCPQCFFSLFRVCTNFCEQQSIHKCSSFLVVW